jgi:hypothetical protein
MASMSASIDSMSCNKEMVIDKHERDEMNQKGDSEMISKARTNLPNDWSA